MITGVLASLGESTAQVLQRQEVQRQAAEAERRFLAARGAVAELQEALLPPTVPVLPWARIAARYLVAGQDQSAGGDWLAEADLTAVIAQADAFATATG